MQMIFPAGKFPSPRVLYREAEKIEGRHGAGSKNYQMEGKRCSKRLVRQGATKKASHWLN